jgi:ABC-type amino acid transport substrate-binding protein
MRKYQNINENGSNLSRRGFIRSVSALGLSAGALGSLGGRLSWAADAPKIKTIEPGVLTVATLSAMPITDLGDGRFIGTDGEIVSTIAEKLGLKVKVNLMEWSSTIESVKTGRADLMCCNMGWSEKRSQIMLLTDAIYYVSQYATMKADKATKPRLSVSDFTGHTIGAVTGTTVIPEMKRIPGVVDVKMYDNIDSSIRDVVAGRLDFGVLDAPLVDYMIQQNVDWGVKQLPLEENADYPALTGKQHTVIGMNMENTELFDAVNTGVRWLQRTKKNAELLAKYGIKDPDYLVPPAKNPRIGVDRDATGNVIGPGAHTAKDFSALFT